MENTRRFSFIVMIIALVMLVMAWQGDIETLRRRASEPKADTAEIISGSSSGTASLIKVKTDVYDLTINRVGGDIIDASLLNFQKTVDDPTPLKLLKSQSNFTYTVMSGLVGRDGPDGQAEGRPSYSTEKDEYSLQEGQEELIVPLVYKKNGVTFTKNFIFRKGRYDVEISYQIQNGSSLPINVKPFGQIKQSVQPQEASEGEVFMAGSYRGAVISTDEKNYKKIDLIDLTDRNEDIVSKHIMTKGGWIGMIQHYFATAYVSSSSAGTNEIYAYGVDNEAAAIIGIKGQIIEVAAGQSANITDKVWIGPKLQKEMDEMAPHLGLTLDYGWLWFISEALVALLNYLHSFIGNWGFSIIAITCIVRGLMYPLTRAQYTSMAKMKLLAPKMKEIRERYQSDPQTMQRETMELYKREKVNPLAGCLPILIQMPIFIALYWALMESVELRQSPFILWIKDLSVNDPYFILPLLYGATMFIVQKMSQGNAQMSDMQKKVFTFMPIVFTLMFMMFPSGLTLYWTASNIFTIIQLKFIYSHLEKIGLHERKKKKA